MNDAFPNEDGVVTPVKFVELVWLDWIGEFVVFVDDGVPNENIEFFVGAAAFEIVIFAGIVEGVVTGFIAPNCGNCGIVDVVLEIIELLVIFAPNMAGAALTVFVVSVSSDFCLIELPKLNVDVGTVGLALSLICGQLNSTFFDAMSVFGAPKLNVGICVVLKAGPLVEEDTEVFDEPKLNDGIDDIPIDGAEVVVIATSDVLISEATDADAGNVKGFATSMIGFAGNVISVGFDVSTAGGLLTISNAGFGAKDVPNEYGGGAAVIVVFGSVSGFEEVVTFSAGAEIVLVVVFTSVTVSFVLLAF